MAASVHRMVSLQKFLELSVDHPITRSPKLMPSMQGNGPEADQCIPSQILRISSVVYVTGLYFPFTTHQNILWFFKDGEGQNSNQSI